MGGRDLGSYLAEYGPQLLYGSEGKERTDVRSSGRLYTRENDGLKLSLPGFDG